MTRQRFGSQSSLLLKTAPVAGVAALASFGNNLTTLVFLFILAVLLLGSPFLTGYVAMLPVLGLKRQRPRVSQGLMDSSSAHYPTRRQEPVSCSRSAGA
jgi:hypothetical protein